MNDTDNKTDLIEIAGLWLTKAASGESYFSGTLGKARVLIFKNRFKKEDKHPDYRMYVTRRKPKNNEDPLQADHAGAAPTPAEPPPQDSDADTPF